MRKSLNGNPVVAIVVIGILGVGVAFLLLTQMSKGGSSSSSTSTSTTPAAGTTSTSAATTATPGASATASSSAVPATPSAVPGATTATPEAPTAAPVGAFVAGPGLPAPVADAYRRGQVVGLLITKPNGIEDKDVRKGFRLVQAIPGVAAFETTSRHVARYARIAEGVELDRVPAMIVVLPRSNTKTQKPAKASVTYGFNSPQALVQAVRNALYHGPAHLPYHPR